MRRARPTSSFPARPAHRREPEAPDDHDRGRRSRLPNRRPRTSSSPAPTTTPASIPTRRTPARSATARTSANAATRSWCGGSTPRPIRSPCCRSPATCMSRSPVASKQRINSAYRRDDPSQLQDTIFLNFGIPIDHYIQVDFCAFKRLVDGVGGVKVPFEYPARDTNTGLDVPASGGECFKFDGDHALAYVRSRHYEYQVDGEWKTDGTSDFGRISRQQDFLRRTVASLLGRGPFSPSVATALLKTNRQYLDDRPRAHTRQDARVRRRAALARPERDHVVPDRVDARRTCPASPCRSRRLKGENMQEILAVFRGEAPLAEAPDQVFESTTSAATRPGVTTGESAPHHGDRRQPAVVPRRTRSGSRRRATSPAERPRRPRRRIDHSSSARREARRRRDAGPATVTTGPRPATPAPRPRRCRRPGRRSRARRGAAAAPTTSPGSVARQSDSNTVMRAPGRRPCQLLAGRTQRPGEVGRAEAAEREHGVDRPVRPVACGPATWPRSRPCRTTAPSSRRAPATTRPPRRPPTWRAAGPPSSRCDRRAGRSPSPAVDHARTRRSVRIDGLAGRTRRGDRIEAGVEIEVAPIGPVRQLGQATRPRAVSSGRGGRCRGTGCAAMRFANSRSLGSVAPVRSASIASTSSGSSASASSTAASSSSPTSGEICSKRGLRASSRRDVVRLRACSTASSAASPSFVGGDFSESWWPQSGRQLFPRRHRPRTRSDRTRSPTAR